MVGGVWRGFVPPVDSSDEHDEDGDADNRLVHDWSVKKRLRKKLRRFEFRELGFEVRFLVAETVIDDALDRFWDELIGEGIEGAGLMCGGGGDHAWELVVFRARGCATDADRVTLAEWLQRHPAVSDVEVGPLFDLWHGPDAP